MSDYTSGAIHFSGLGNGVDFSSIIDATITAQSYQVKRYTAWRSEWETKQTALNELNTKLLSLQTTLEDLSTPDKFMVKNASSSDSDLATATAKSAATEGSHTLIINQLAKNDIWVADTTETSTSTSITSSDQTFSFTYSNASISISANAGTTLDGLVNLINNNSQAAGKVRASTVYDGSGYHLQLAGKEQGAAKAIVIHDTGFTGYTPSDFTQTSTAQNSQIRVDGYPAGGWLERSTNSPTDVVEGLTLNLLKASPGDEITLTVSTDKDKIKENVKTFVTQVNDVLTKMQELTKVTATTDNKVKGSVLTGNYGVENLINGTVKDILSGQALGFRYYDSTTGMGDKYSTLSQVGITTDATQGSETVGLLTLDDDDLDAALDDDPTAVAKLFSVDYEGATDTTDFTYTSHIKGISKPGTYEVAYGLNPWGLGAAYMNGHTATVGADGRTITGQAGYDEAGISVTVTNMTGFSGSGNVYLKQGKIGQLIDSLKTLTNSTSGPIHILDENYQDIMDNIDKKIAQEETRLDQKRRDLTAQYAKLDVLLGRYQNMGTALTSQIAQLG